MEPLAEPGARGACATARSASCPSAGRRCTSTGSTNIRDWNISRQLWWGHRIPVWYCDDCDPPTTSSRAATTSTQCPHCGGPVRQDEDVLDTWFSSWLWPISTLGWPTRRRRTCARSIRPTCSSPRPEILFFWVARMIMSGYEFMGEAPFHTVYLHGTVRDTQHRKMSKSLGNGIDPLDVVQLYGADALRWTLIAGMGMGADIMLDPERPREVVRAGPQLRHEALEHRPLPARRTSATTPVRPLDEHRPRRARRAPTRGSSRASTRRSRMRSRRSGPLRPPRRRRCGATSERDAGLRLNEYAETARRFVWNELADWYLEAIKARLATPGDDREVARAVLVHAFDQALRLLHPIVPFVTEALWQRLPGRVDGEFLATARVAGARTRVATPMRGARVRARARGGERDAPACAREYGVAPGKSIEAFVVAVAGDRAPMLERRGGADRAAGARDARRRRRGAERRGGQRHQSRGGTELIVPLAGLIDVDEGMRAAARRSSRSSRSSSRRSRRGWRTRIRRARASRTSWTAERAKQRRVDDAARAAASRKVRALCGG